MKTPKIRFRPGMRFEFEGETWEIILSYRVVKEPHIWYHRLESMPKQPDEIGDFMVKTGLATQVKDLIVEPLRNHYEADKILRDRYRYGDEVTRTTQELIHSKRVT